MNVKPLKNLRALATYKPSKIQIELFLSLILSPGLKASALLVIALKKQIQSQTYSELIISD